MKRGQFIASLAALPFIGKLLTSTEVPLKWGTLHGTITDGEDLTKLLPVEMKPYRFESKFKMSDEWHEIQRLNNSVYEIQAEDLRRVIEKHADEISKGLK